MNQGTHATRLKAKEKKGGFSEEGLSRLLGVAVSGETSSIDVNLEKFQGRGGGLDVGCLILRGGALIQDTGKGGGWYAVIHRRKRRRDGGRHNKERCLVVIQGPRIGRGETLPRKRGKKGVTENRVTRASGSDNLTTASRSQG